MRAACAFAILVSMSFVGLAQFAPFKGPQTYQDPRTGIILYLESDGRHIAAISRDGKLLWARDPFADSHLPFYRTNKPQSST